MICFTAPDAYIVVGAGLRVARAGAENGEGVGLLDVEEWRCDESGTWMPFRRLNGDQTHQGREVRLPPGSIGMQVVRLFRFR